MQLYTTSISLVEDGWMVKDVLASMRFSRKLRHAVLSSSGLCLNGAPVYWTSRVRVGDRLTMDVPEEHSETVIPENLPLRVAFEDEHILVVDKEPGMVVHPTGSHKQGTLVSAVAYYTEQMGETLRCRPIHRLDRDTSGLILFAKHKLAHERLVRSLLARQVKRHYCALVAGRVPFTTRRVEAAICRPNERSLKRAVAPYGKHAVTHVQTLARYTEVPISLLALQLETGRTHQIRVHMAYLGYPVLGDWLYGNAEAEALGIQVAHHLLHAGRLVFPHPMTEGVVDLSAALPLAMQTVISSARHGGVGIV